MASEFSYEDISSQSFLAKYGEYYDKQNRLLKKIHFSEYKVIDGVQRVLKIVINNGKPHSPKSKIMEEASFVMNTR